ncbi:4Fe-4S ferredoxin [Halorubrum distributum JCM 9100]|uniref:4Fe-4S ferredoxin n=2 Tax=Halorubrum distributum TaxID=29283 RepID=M0EVP9_9EURY|nr:4Fe-4S binding protein [Halorubrum distributum]ELZ51143.1 4Fe-4S ferredoxin [Halorubrum distributum JCM 9100]ELZ53062.1 4Fe-4S ferredoxin [Halorubrum distributum JCM 10118]
MSLRDRASELVDGVRSVTAGERTKRLVERVRRVRDGESWFDKRGLDTIRRRPVDDDSIERRRRWQRFLGVAFVGLLAAAFWYPLVAGVGVVGCAAAAVGVGAVRGRFYCNHLCPRSGMLDGYVRLFSRGRRTPDWFKHPLTRAAVALTAFGLLGTGLHAAWRQGGSLGVPFLTMLGVSTLVAVGLGVAYHQRAWCQICPAGTLSHAVHRVAEALGRDSAPRVEVDADACVSCGRCGTVCRQEIRPGQYAEGEVTDHGDVFSPGGLEGSTREVDGVVDHADCLQCAACVEECPTDALSLDEE